jgi:peptidoglycan/xylan/chitin deacetylase (PgdA/CDA1 family)
VIETSVIIATYNRVGRLRACLEALTRQTAPASEFEVIVVVDGSTDATLDWLATFQAPYALRVVPQDNRGEGAARNRGVQVARGRICIFLDDDIVATPDFIAEHMRLHRRQAGAVGLGELSLSLGPRPDWFLRGFAREWRKHYASLNQGRQPTWLDCYAGNMSVACAVFEGVGGFDASLVRGCDVELAYRLARRGCGFVYLPGAAGHQDERKHFQPLVADVERSGAACVELYRRYPEVLPSLLGQFGEQPAGMATALRVLLALDLPPQRLDVLGRLLSTWVGTEQAYHLLRRYGFWRGVRHAWPDQSGWSQLIGGTPILMYHAFGAARQHPTRYVVPASRFARQMAWLTRAGYQVLSLADLVRYRAEHRLPPHKSVVVTIDDGYSDTLLRAYPILRRHRIPATVFLVSDAIGCANQWDHDTELAGRPLLSWAEINALLTGGLQFGAHTRTHQDLTAISGDEARLEIIGSRNLLEERLGVPVRAFAYPYGKHTPAVAGLVQEAGFEVGCGIDAGLNTPATPGHALRRVEIWGTDSLLDFTVAVRFGARPAVVRQRITHILSRSGRAA